MIQAPFALTPQKVAASVDGWTITSTTPPPLIALTSSANDSSALPYTANSLFSVYAYSYWRRPSDTASLATAGQYGGSQSGLVAAYQIWPEARLDTQLRFAFTPQRHGEREAALGIRWQPLKTVPLRIIAERRFRYRAVDSFAVTLAGGTNPLHLPTGFTLENYGQAGWANGAGGGWFFDASAQVTKPVIRHGQASIALGVGAWAGGQRGVQRIDAGPRLDIKLSPAKNPLRLSADWRFRLAGDARPGNGPALTLSTAF